LCRVLPARLAGDILICMSLPFVVQSLFLIFSVVFAFFWVADPNLSYYSLQLIGLFILLYFISSFMARKNPRFRKTNQIISSIVFNMIILLLVVSTGNLESPVFFLMYFLLFGLSFLFQPIVSLVLTLSYTFVCILTGQANGTKPALSLVSLWFITPLALFFGKSYLDQLVQKEKIKILHQKKKKTDQQIAHDETDVMMWLTLDFKNNIAVIMEQTSNLIAGMINLPVSQKKSLEKIRTTCRRLLRSSELLKKRVDELTDSS